MRCLRRASLIALAAVFLFLALAPGFSLTARAESADAPSDTAPADTGAPAGEGPVYGNYTMIWVSLLIGLICILLAAAIFFFTGNN